MGFVIGAVLFLLPFGLFLLWRRANPDIEPSSRLLAAAGLGVVLAVSGFLLYGMGRSMERGERYVPARLGPDGRIERGHGEGAPSPAPPPDVRGFAPGTGR